MLIVATNHHRSSQIIIVREFLLLKQQLPCFGCYTCLAVFFSIRLNVPLVYPLYPKPRAHAYRLSANDLFAKLFDIIFHRQGAINAHTLVHAPYAIDRLGYPRWIWVAATAGPANSRRIAAAATAASSAKLCAATSRRVATSDCFCQRENRIRAAKV